MLTQTKQVLTDGTRIEDLVIYELHVNALGFGQNRAGNLEDAINLLPQLSDLGINAIELLPMSTAAYRGILNSIAKKSGSSHTL